jgi:mono/diheme cytochrome c family protein
VIVRLAILVLLAATSAALAEGSPSPLEQRGRALAERMCSQCHAIGKSGQSPHAGAPAFRALDRRVDLEGTSNNSGSTRYGNQGGSIVCSV